MTDTTDIKALREKLWDLDEAHDLRQLGDDIIDQLEAKDEAIKFAVEVARTASLKIDRLEAELAALKTKLANPVVHPTRAPGHSYASNALSARDEQWFTAINEAGFWVEEE